MGTGLGVLNAADQEVLASKLGSLGKELHSMSQPLNTSLTQLADIQQKVTSILPDWLQMQTQDNLKIIAALGGLQTNVS